MKLRLVNVSVVLVGEAYAPAVFTHDFLRSIKIAKKGWELTEPPLITPAVSVLKYSNGITLAIETNRLQVLDNTPQHDFGTSEVGSIATKLLPHLSYSRHTAVGINVIGFIEHISAVKLLVNKFIKEGDWLVSNLNGVTVEFIYPQGDSNLTLSYSVGSAQLAGEKQQRQGLGITANYHTSISSTVSLEASAREAQRHIGRIAERTTDFVKRVGQIFTLEETTNDV